MICTTKAVLRALFLAFLAINAWNTLKNFDDHHTEFVQSHNTFKTTLETRTGMQVPVEASALFMMHSENIAKYLLWATLALSAASLVLSKCLTWTVGLIYLAKTMVTLNVAAFNCQTPLTEWERLAFAVSIFAGSIAFSCMGKKGKCGKKAEKPTETTQKTAKNQNRRKGNRRRD